MRAIYGTILVGALAACHPGRVADPAAARRSVTVFDEVAALEANPARTAAQLDRVWWLLNLENNPELADGFDLHAGLCTATARTMAMLIQAVPDSRPVVEHEYLVRLKHQLTDCPAVPPAGILEKETKGWLAARDLPEANWASAPKHRAFVELTVESMRSDDGLVVTVPELVGFHQEDRGYVVEGGTSTTTLEHDNYGHGVLVEHSDPMRIKHDVATVADFQARPDRLAVVGSPSPNLPEMIKSVVIYSSGTTHTSVVDGASVALTAELLAAGFDEEHGSWRWVAWADRASYRK